MPDAYTLGLRERIFSRIEYDTFGGCWLWAGGYGPGRYGSLRVRGVTTPAHRATYELLVGPIPAGLYVCHRCDVPACVNPSHMFLGTQSENMRDALRKGRVGPARLKPDDVLAIRKRVASGERVADIAADYGVGLNAIYRVNNGERWRSLTSSDPEHEIAWFEQRLARAEATVERYRAQLAKLRSRGFSKTRPELP